MSSGEEEDGETGPKFVTNRDVELMKKFFLHYMVLGYAKTGVDLQRIDVSLKLRGTTAGMALYNSFTKKSFVRINADLYARNRNQFQEDTIPHEIAHLLTKAKYGDVSPHGDEWKHVMRLLGKDPKRTHMYDVKETKLRKTLRAVFRCVPCGVEPHTSHTKYALATARGIKFMCPKCRGSLVFLGEVLR